MEDTLRDNSRLRLLCSQSRVLILVLMEDTLRVDVERDSVWHDIYGS